MPTPPTNARKRSPTPSVVALRRAVASSTALETGQNIQQLEQNCSSPPRSGLPTSSWPPEASQSQVQRSPNPELHGLVVHGHTGVDGRDVLPPVALPGAVVQWVSPRLHRHH